MASRNTNRLFGCCFFEACYNALVNLAQPATRLGALCEVQPHSPPQRFAFLQYDKLRNKLRQQKHYRVKPISNDSAPFTVCGRREASTSVGAAGRQSSSP